MRTFPLSDLPQIKKRFTLPGCEERDEPPASTKTFVAGTENIEGLFSRSPRCLPLGRLERRPQTLTAATPIPCLSSSPSPEGAAGSPRGSLGGRRRGLSEPCSRIWRGTMAGGGGARGLVGVAEPGLETATTTCSTSWTSAAGALAGVGAGRWRRGPWS